MKTEEQAETLANAFQRRINKIYSDKNGRRVKIKMINAQEFNGAYQVQISALELDSSSPNAIHVTETSDFFFQIYQPN